MVALIPARSEALLSACLAVRSAVFTKEYGIPQTMERDAADALGTGCEHFLVRMNGQDAGALRCVFPAPGVVRLQRFCILSDLRGMASSGGAAALEEFYHDQAGSLNLVPSSAWRGSILPVATARYPMYLWRRASLT